MNVGLVFGKPVQMPTSRALQQFRWFTASFNNEVAAQSAKSGIQLEVSDPALARVFLDWRNAFMAQRPQNPAEREKFVAFAAGLLLGFMIRHAPAEVRSAPRGKNDLSSPRDFWPEGHVYVTYCLTMRAAILEEEFGHELNRPPELDDIRTWHSFRENMAEDPSLAIPFLDLFAGERPNWPARDIFN